MHNPTRRLFLKTTAGLAAAVAATPVPARDSETDQQKPNVIILLIDDLGYGDLACFGNNRTPTPHIDSLAQKGTKCTMSYITNPPCSPSRCALMTGMYAQRFGKSGMARGLPIPDDHPTMAEFMRDAGYVTGQIGKWDIGSSDQGPSQRGFMEVAKRPPGKHYDVTRKNGEPVYRTELAGDYMVEFVERNRNKPFFLYFSPLAIHSPLGGTPQRYRDRVKGGKGTAYEGAVVALDDQIGKLITALKKHGLEKNTLILLTGDNGAGGGGSSAPYRGGKGKGTQQEGWVHTPTIACWPECIPAGVTYDGLMCTLDFYATVAAAIRKKLPERCDGKDIVPYLRGEKKGDVHEYIYWHNADPTDMSHRNLYAVRWKQWRLVKNKSTETWQLFDLKNDPQEMRDLADEQPEVAGSMHRKYKEFIATLPAIKPSKDYKGARKGGRIEQGWGWVIGDGEQSRARE